MSKIVYLLGAGASYGERDEQKIILRGVPIVSEISDTIKQVILYIKAGHYNNLSKNDYNQNDQERVISELNWLEERCKDYPTIDTYARLLYVSGDINNYNKLKRALSVFLLLIQEVNKRDLRYDGFIASLINDNGLLPDISLLSWNYDAQFEFAYSGYVDQNNRKMLQIWKYLGILHKNIPLQTTQVNKFSITKLNGTAFSFINNNQMLDIFFNHQGQSLVNLSSLMLSEIGNIQSGLSFAWEKEEKDKNRKNQTFIEQVQTKTDDAEVLVVIGYSFPYVNKEIDKKILDSMQNLKKIYIQDPNADEIKESLLARLYPKKETDYEWMLSTNTRQFIIPNELT